MDSYVISNANIITINDDNDILDEYAVKISNGIIDEIDKTDTMLKRYPGLEELDAGGKYLIPGGICAHTHFYSTFSRGLYNPANPEKFSEILETLWWKLDKSLDEKSVYFSAMVSLINAIHNGTTTLFDHHSSPGFITGSLDVLEKAVNETGLNACLCYEITDRNGEKRRDKAIEESFRFIDKVKINNPVNISALLGLHAGFTVSDETIELCLKRMKGQNIPIHIHVGEDPIDQIDSKEKYGLSVVERLNKSGILAKHSILAHCVNISDKELNMINEKEIFVTHQPRSNMNNAVGFPDIEKILKMGITVGLGNDGFSNAMWEEWKTAYLGHKLLSKNPKKMNGADIMRIATTSNNIISNIHFKNKITGSIMPGNAADLVLVDYHPITELTKENLPWHIIFGFEESMIRTTISNGKVIMLDGKILTIDEESVLQEAKEISKFVWKKYLQ